MPRIPAKKRSASLRYYYRRLRKYPPNHPRFTMAGRRRLRPYKKYFSAAAKRRAHNARTRKWLRARAEKRMAQGLTWKGTPRKNRVFPQLRGLRLGKSEYTRRVYHILKAERTRSALTTLVAGKGSLITKLK